MKSNRKNAPGRGITRNIVILGAVSLFTDAASEMIYPLIPVFVTLLGSSVLILGVIEGAAETTAALLKLASGILSDRIGKRKVLVVIGYGISTLIRPFTGIVAAASQIIWIRMIDRVGKGIRTAPRDALIASSTDEGSRGKAFGFHRAMDHAGAVIGPVLAILALILLIHGFGLNEPLSILRWTFLLSIIPGLCAVLLLIIFLQEKSNPVRTGSGLQLSFRQFDGNFIRYLSIIVLFTLGNSSDAFLLFRIQDALHESETLYSLFGSAPIIGDIVQSFGDIETRKKIMDILFLPLIWAFFHIIKVIFSTRLGALSDKIGRKTVITAGWTVYALVYFAFAMLDRFPDGAQIAMTFVLFAVYAFYYAFTEGAEKAFVADLVKPGLRGSAFGLYNFSVGLTAFPASILFGFLYQRLGAAAAFGTGACIAVLSMGLFHLFVKENRKNR